jgi:hypothetical protein
MQSSMQQFHPVIKVDNHNKNDNDHLFMNNFQVEMNERI